MAVAPSDINPATGKQYAVNPSSGVWDDNYFAKTYGGGSGQPTGSQGASTSGLNTTDILGNAQKMQDFYRQQNQPVIQSYEASKTPLKQRYDDLLASIKGNQQVAENRQTVTTSNELGKRGITSSSGIAQQEMTNALNPITRQYTQLAKDTTNQQNIEMAGIDRAIAQLMAGNPESAVSSASNFASMQQAANQFQQEMDAKLKQQAIDNAIKQQAADQRNTSVVEIGGRRMLIDTQTGETIKDLGMSGSGNTEDTWPSLIEAFRSKLGGGETEEKPNMQYYSNNSSNSLNLRNALPGLKF